MHSHGETNVTVGAGSFAEHRSNDNYAIKANDARFHSARSYHVTCLCEATSEICIASAGQFRVVAENAVANMMSRLSAVIHPANKSMTKLAAQSLYFQPNIYPPRSLRFTTGIASAFFRSMPEKSLSDCNVSRLQHRQRNMKSDGL